MFIIAWDLGLILSGPFPLGWEPIANCSLEALVSIYGTRHSVWRNEAWGWPGGWMGPLGQAAQGQLEMAGVQCGGGGGHAPLQGQVHLCSWPREGETSGAST